MIDIKAWAERAAKLIEDDTPEKITEWYADEVAKEFAEWIRGRYERYATGWTKKKVFLETVEKDDVLTTEQLFNFFKQEQS